MTNPATSPAAYLTRSFTLEGKLAVVTGARQGIGLAITEALASAGADIIGVSNDLPLGESAARTTVEQVGRTFTPLRVDLSVRDEVSKLAADLAGRRSTSWSTTVARSAGPRPPSTPTTTSTT